MSDFKATESIEEFSKTNYRDLVEIPSHEVCVVDSQDIDEKQQELVDFEQARQNIKDILTKGSDVLDDMISLAKASDHPRAFEVAANLIKTMVEANKDLIDLHKKKKDLTPKQDMVQAGQPTQNVQNNTVFVGSAKDLLDVISK